jgi:hypothetical protein
MAKHAQFYRLGAVSNVTGERCVEKVVMSHDGTRNFEKQAKVIAPSLEVFMREYPGTSVRGVDVTPKDVASRLASFNDDELRELGLVRAASIAGSDSVFASEVAADLAKNLNPDLFPAGEGSGKGGTYTAGDVREKIDTLNA